MPKAKASLLDAPRQHQLPLTLDSEPPSAILTPSRNPAYTGERFFLEHPEDYQRICAMLADGATMSAAARAVGCCRNTVKSVVIKETASISVERLQAQTARRYRLISILAQDRTLEELEGDHCNARAAKDLIAIAAVATDKGELLDGRPTARVACAAEAPSIQDAAAMLDLLRIGYDAGKCSSQKNGAFHAQVEDPATAQAGNAAHLVIDVSQVSTD